jgi:hypothetical protein
MLLSTIHLKKLRNTQDFLYKKTINAKQTISQKTSLHSSASIRDPQKKKTLKMWLMNSGKSEL